LAQHRRRQRIIAASAAVLIAALAGVSWLAVEARVAKREAERESEIAGRTAQDRETERKQVVVKLAAADEQLDSHGSVEQQRQCVEATNRFAGDPPPPATPDFPAGVWHVDQGISSTYTDWKADGTCDQKHLIELGRERNMQGDVCRWKFTKLGAHRYALDYQSTILNENYPKHLEFEIIDPVRIHNEKYNYDAVRIICPAQELAIRQRQLADAQQRAAANPTDVADQKAVAGAFDKLGRALQGQRQFKDAVTAFAGELDQFRLLERRDAVNPAWQIGSADSLEQLGDSYMSLEQYTNARDAYQRSLELRRGVLAVSGNDVSATQSTALALTKLGLAAEWITRSRQPQSRAAFQQAVQLLQSIVAAGRATPAVELQLINTLESVAVESDGEEKKSALTAALKLAEELDRDHELGAEYIGVPEYLRVQLANLP
jgi:tetratricopeptide (TPR) repeat protein